MIKADKGDFQIVGTPIDIIFEFNLILTQMAEVCPEILCSVLAERNDTIMRVVGKLDLEGFKHYVAITREYKEAYKEERGHEC